MVTSVCGLRSISAFVLHTQFNILSWIFSTFMFDVVPIKKKISTYLRPF